MGPIWINDSQVLLGAWVDRRNNVAMVSATTGQPQTPRSITAKLFGGALAIEEGWITLGPEPRYAVKAQLTNGDLALCAREVGASRRNLQGTVFATTLLTGSGRSRNALLGKGTVRLSDGNVYELPVMFALLKLLGIRPPDQNAFSAATIDYRIEGEHIYFDRIDFRGDVISLRGEGQMDFQSQLDLTFSTKVGSGEIALPFVNQLFKGASEQIMVIHVGGTLQNPETRREALPGVNRVLQQLNGGSSEK